MSEERCRYCGNYGDGWASVAYGPVPVDLFIAVKDEKVYWTETGAEYTKVECKNIPDKPKEVIWVGGLTNLFVMSGGVDNKEMATSRDGFFWETVKKKEDCSGSAVSEAWSRKYRIARASFVKKDQSSGK